jgi:hypothetical protein
MAQDPAPIDITTMPDLARLVDEVYQTRRPRRLRRGTQGIAVIVPASIAEPAPGRQEHTMTMEQFKQTLATPPTPEELARRQALVARIKEARKARVITPLTTADLVRQAREEKQMAYGSDH